MGVEVLTPKKGIFIDGHEREDVVVYRKVFLQKMLKIGFLHFTNAPTESAQKALPVDIEPPTLECREKTVVYSMMKLLFRPMKTNLYSGV